MRQQYIIFFKGQVFLTKWFDVENNFMPTMIVIDTYAHTYFDDTCNAVWKPLNEDHL